MRIYYCDICFCKLSPDTGAYKLTFDGGEGIFLEISDCCKSCRDFICSSVHGAVAKARLRAESENNQISETYRS